MILDDGSLTPDDLIKWFEIYNIKLDTDGDLSDYIYGINIDLLYDNKQIKENDIEFKKSYIDNKNKNAILIAANKLRIMLNKKYENKNESIVWKDIDDLSDEEENYLHGQCDKWVQENALDDDILVVLTQYDDDIETDAILHCFIIRNGMYLDVRGETTNFDDILDEFDYDEFQQWEFSNIDEFNEFITKLENYREV